MLYQITFDKNPFPVFFVSGEGGENTQILSMEKNHFPLLKTKWKLGNESWEKSLKSFTIKKLYHVNVQPTVSSFIEEIFPLNCILKNIDGKQSSRRMFNPRHIQKRY